MSKLKKLFNPSTPDVKVVEQPDEMDVMSQRKKRKAAPRQGQASTRRVQPQGVLGGEYTRGTLG